MPFVKKQKLPTVRIGICLLIACLALGDAKASDSCTPKFMQTNICEFASNIQREIAPSPVGLLSEKPNDSLYSFPSQKLKTIKSKLANGSDSFMS